MKLIWSNIPVTLVFHPALTRKYIFTQLLSVWFSNVMETTFVWIQSHFLITVPVLHSPIFRASPCKISSPFVSKSNFCLGYHCYPETISRDVLKCYMRYPYSQYIKTIKGT